jgi:hypothetical protein
VPLASGLLEKSRHSSRKQEVACLARSPSALFALGVCAGFRVGKHCRVNASDLEAFLKSQLRVIEADAPIEQVSEAMEQVQRD